MRTVVTGAAGFIGSTLTDLLLSEGHEVIAVDNFDDYYSGKMRFLSRHLGNDAFRLKEVDILDIDALRQSFEDAEVVFHLAAQAGVRISVKDPLRSHHANTTGTLNVLLAARDEGVRRVVSSSSSSVYGNAVRLPAGEGDLTVPISPYAASKLAAEYYCSLFYKLYGLESVSLRYFTVYGPRQRPDMAIRIFTDRALDGKRPQIFGDGEQTRDFTFITDVVDAIRRCADCPDPKGEPLNVCSGSTVSVNQVVRSILKSVGREDLEPEYLPPQPGDVDHTWGDNSKAKRLLGWEPKVMIDEGLRRFVDWYKKEGKV
ncbi:MAG: NAD-dependent epimerase/dehydratase family protein [Methanomassiliicoccus sp.]|nr:MAG: NAD-dependent epimerase/dehydratase family protein [Methanomassiliicoccus sp.]